MPNGGCARAKNSVKFELLKPMGDKSLVLIFVIGLFLYSSWTIFVVATGKPIDYYTYVISAYGFLHSQNMYLAPQTAYAAIARSLGISEWGPPGYVYPPLTAIIALPLTFLPLQLSTGLWVFSSGVASMAAALLLCKRDESRWRKRLILVSSILFAPILATLGLGQVNAFILLLTTYALSRWLQGKDASGGAALAIGIWMKPLSIALLGLVLLRERWRALAGILAASLLIIPLSMLLLGIESTFAQLSPYGWILQPTVNPQSLANVQLPDNQNLIGLFSRMLAPSKQGFPLVDAPQLVPYFYWGSVVVLLGVTLWLLWPFGRRAQWSEFEFALLIMTTLLISPLTKYHHLALGFVAFAVLIPRWKSWQCPSWNILALGVAYAMINMQGLLLHEHFSGQIRLLDLATMGEMIIWVLLVFRLRALKLSQVT
jgi:hypothetical protein